MAQRPWEVLRERPVTLSEASEFMHKALKDLGGSSSSVSSSRKSESSAPCPQHTLDSMVRLMSQLDEVIKDKKQRRVFEGISKHSTSSADPLMPQGAGQPTQFTFKKMVIRGLAQLVPLYLGNTEYGIKLFLSNFLLGFVPEFEGVWCAFRKVRSTDDKGFSYDAERMGVLVFRIDLEILVFVPKQGHTLLGEVSEVRNDGLDALVLGTWLVTIPSNRLLEGSTISHKRRRVTDEGGEEEYAQGAVIKVVNPLKPGSEPMIIKRGSSVKFAVMRLKCSSEDGKEFFAIVGSLRPLKLQPKSQ